MAFDNLPTIIGQKLDGSFAIVPVNDNPIVMILGTASQGVSETVYRVDRVSDAARVFGKSGTLTRGLYEASIGGALNLRLFRIGATAAKLAGIGGGITLETIRKDDSAGGDYNVEFDATSGRLKVYRASDDELVYDNYPAYPLQKVDLGEVVAYGTATETSSDYDIALAAMEDATATVPPTFTAGTDGLNLSRMQLFEALYNAYELLADQEIDVVVPMNVFLDDKNVMDLTPTQITALGLASLSDYPGASDVDDVLGKLYVEEYEGVNYFWWWFPADPTDETFTAAQIYTASGVGSASATAKCDGTALAASDFHEVNFAYQLANFCFTQSENNTEMTGVVGVLPPSSYSLKDVALWVGKLPTTTEDANGNVVIASGGNGTGLLGNKFMSGRIGVTNELIPYTIDGVAGLYNGGFIGTETGWLDDSQLSDANDHLVDIGKYISVVASYPTLSNPSNTVAYVASGAATYGGFYSVLPSDSAPTNKLLRNLRLPFRVSTAKLDLLAGQRFVTFHAKTRGIVVSDAPTAARPDSDYQRLSTVRQVKAAIDAVRTVGEPFLGEGLTGARLAALDTAIESALKALVKSGVISRFEHSVTSTAQQRILGQATVELKLVPAFELRQITVVVALAAV